LVIKRKLLLRFYNLKTGVNGVLGGDQFKGLPGKLLRREIKNQSKQASSRTGRAATLAFRLELRAAMVTAIRMMTMVAACQFEK